MAKKADNKPLTDEAIGGISDSLLEKDNSYYNAVKSGSLKEVATNPITNDKTEYVVENGQLWIKEEIPDEDILWYKQQAKIKGMQWQAKLANAQYRASKGEIGAGEALNHLLDMKPAFFMPTSILNHILNVNFMGMSFDQVRAEKATNDRFWKIISSDYRDFISNGTDTVYFPPTNESFSTSVEL